MHYSKRIKTDSSNESPSGFVWLRFWLLGSSEIPFVLYRAFIGSRWLPVKLMNPGRCSILSTRLCLLGSPQIVFVLVIPNHHLYSLCTSLMLQTEPDDHLLNLWIVDLFTWMYSNRLYLCWICCFTCCINLSTSD